MNEGTYYPAASLYTLPNKQQEGATVTLNFGAPRQSRACKQPVPHTYLMQTYGHFWKDVPYAAPPMSI